MTLAPIETPRRRLLRLWGMQFGPVAMWLGAVSLCIFIGRRESASPPATGLVVAEQTEIISLVPSRLATLRVSLFDEVKAGDVLATLDDSEFSAELKVQQMRLEIAEAEVNAEKARLGAESLQVGNENSQALAQLSREAGQAALETLDRQVELETLRIELERRNLQKTTLEQLANIGVMERVTFEETLLRIATLEKQIEGAGKALEEWQAFSKAAAQRVEEARSPADFIDDQVEPLRREVNLVSAEIELLRQKTASLVVRAPMDGIVTELHVQPGATLREGDAIALLTASTAHEVLAYLPENSHSIPKVGGKLRIKSKDGRLAVSATTSSVGPAVVAVPARLNHHPNVQDFALPVLLELPPQHGFRPGQMVLVNGK